MGVTILAVLPWHPLLHNGFFKEKKNGEASSERWDLVRNILEWSEDLPDFESSTLQVTACFS